MAQAQQAFSHLPKEILELVQIFAEAGEEISLVGGPVRDAFLGLTPHDFDCTTSARPEKTENYWRSGGMQPGILAASSGPLVVAAESWSLSHNLSHGFV